MKILIASIALFFASLTISLSGILANKIALQVGLSTGASLAALLICILSAARRNFEGHHLGVHRPHVELGSAILTYFSAAAIMQDISPTGFDEPVIFTSMTLIIIVATYFICRFIMLFFASRLRRKPPV